MSSVSNIFLDKIAEVKALRTSDWKEFYIKTHLGNILKVGDLVIYI